MKAAVITVSTSKAAGEGEDESGPALAELARSFGLEVAGADIVSDDAEAISARLRHRARLGLERDRPGRLVHDRLHVDEAQRQRMGQRDQLGGALGRLHAGDPGRAEHVALRRVAARDRGRRLRRHAYDRARPGPAIAGGLRAHVDHPRAAMLVEMTEP